MTLHQHIFTMASSSLVRVMHHSLPYRRTSTRIPNCNFPNPIITISNRSYRGDSSDMKYRRDISPNPTQDEIIQREEALLKVAAPKYEMIHERHVRMPKLEEIPQASLPLDFQDGDYSKEELELEVRKKRLVYRSKQRGWLEVDVLLGTWASQNVPNLSMDELDEFENFVNLETIDIYNIITLRTDVPQDMKSKDGNSVVERIQEWARSSPLGKGDPEKYSVVKREHNLI
mmetsp:Transcript_2362/g.4402  ORF Transcript_2362/g.4402 Transcript_2362/m.4402 type:complete len:230 (-) Transcript_2362:171-860(-)